MKKKVLSLALLAIAFVGINSFAQTSANGNSAPKQEKTERMKDGKGMRHGHGNPFEGIQLTDAQKTQLEQLRTRDSKNDKANPADCQKKCEKGERPAKPTEEQIAAREARKQQFMNDVKNILTPEQYTTFEQNMSKMSADKNMGKKGNKKMSHKGRHGRQDRGKSAKSSEKANS